MYVKTQMQRLGDYDFGIYIQRPPSREQIEAQREREMRIEQWREAQAAGAPVPESKDPQEAWNF